MALLVGLVAAGAYAYAAVYDDSGGAEPAEPPVTSAVPATAPAPATTVPPTTQPPPPLLPYETNPRGPGSGNDNAEEFKEWLEELRKRFLDD
jgi:hypothetical protein